MQIIFDAAHENFSGIEINQKILQVEKKKKKTNKDKV